MCYTSNTYGCVEYIPSYSMHKISNYWIPTAKGWNPYLEIWWAHSISCQSINTQVSEYTLNIMNSDWNIQQQQLSPTSEFKQWINYTDFHSTATTQMRKQTFNCPYWIFTVISTLKSIWGCHGQMPSRLKENQRCRSTEPLCLHVRLTHHQQKMRCWTARACGDCWSTSAISI